MPTAACTSSPGAGAPGHHGAERPHALSQALLQSGAACGRGLYGRADELRGLDAPRLPHAVLYQPALARLLSLAEGAAAHLARAEALPAGEPRWPGAEKRRPPLRSRQRFLPAVSR